MASTPTKVIRIVMTTEEYERYKPLVTALYTMDMAFLHREDGDGACFDLCPSKQVPTWLRDAARELQEDNINAVVAPECKE